MTIARPCQLLAVGTAMCLGGVLFVGTDSVQHISQGGDASLELVGNLISSVHDIRLDLLDPMYTRCF